MQSFQDSIQLQERLLEVQVHVQRGFLWGESAVPLLEDSMSRTLQFCEAKCHMLAFKSTDPG